MATTKTDIPSPPDAQRLGKVTENGGGNKLEIIYSNYWRTYGSYPLKRKYYTGRHLKKVR